MGERGRGGEKKSSTFQAAAPKDSGGRGHGLPALPSMPAAPLCCSRDSEEAAVPLSIDQCPMKQHFHSTLTTYQLHGPGHGTSFSTQFPRLHHGMSIPASQSYSCSIRKLTWLWGAGGSCGVHHHYHCPCGCICSAKAHRNCFDSVKHVT